SEPTQQPVASSIAVLLATAQRLDPGHTSTSHVRLEWDDRGVAVQRGNRRVVLDGNKLVVQVSRATHRIEPGWLARVLGAEARDEPRLHVGLRTSQGERLALCAPIEDTRL